MSHLTYFIFLAHTKYPTTLFSTLCPCTCKQKLLFHYINYSFLHSQYYGIEHHAEVLVTLRIPEIVQKICHIFEYEPCMVGQPLV